MKNFAIGSLSCLMIDNRFCLSVTEYKQTLNSFLTIKVFYRIV